MLNIFQIRQHFLYSFYHPESASYLGCYIDMDNRALPNHLYEDHDSLTLEKCWAHCRSHNQRYAGLQYMYQCFCGDADTQYYRYGEGDGCDSKCSGDDSQTCGGGWRNSVYDLGELQV